MPNLHLLVLDNIINFNSCLILLHFSPIYLTTSPPSQLTTSVVIHRFTGEGRKFLQRPLHPPTSSQNATALVHPEDHQDWARTAVLAGSSPPSTNAEVLPAQHNSSCCLSSSSLELVPGKHLQGKVKILLPLTHRKYIPEQHWSAAHYWKDCWFRTRRSKHTQQSKQK